MVCWKEMGVFGREIKSKGQGMTLLALENHLPEHNKKVKNPQREIT